MRIIHDSPESFMLAKEFSRFLTAQAHVGESHRDSQRCVFITVNAISVSERRCYVAFNNFL